jgi:hypothetical protein
LTFSQRLTCQLQLPTGFFNARRLGNSRRWLRGGKRCRGEDGFRSLQFLDSCHGLQNSHLRHAIPGKAGLSSTFPAPSARLRLRCLRRFPRQLRRKRAAYSGCVYDGRAHHRPPDLSIASRAATRLVH